MDVLAHIIYKFIRIVLKRLFEYIAKQYCFETPKPSLKYFFMKCVWLEVKCIFKFYIKVFIKNYKKKVLFLIIIIV